MNIHLEKLNELKKSQGIEPPLTELDVNAFLEHIQNQSTMADQVPGVREKTHYAVIETVFREKFNALLESLSIDDPAFTQVWNLLDVVAILSDHELCEPGLIFWLVEELLDSQTIEGCSKVFDYLESRRERITAVSTTRSEAPSRIAHPSRNTSLRKT